MAANNHRVVIETEAHNLAHRLADMFSRDSERIERERAESLAKITTLQQQVIDLSARLTEAQGRAATLTGVEAALARTEGQLDTVRTQLDGTQKELEDTREVNADLKTKLDDTKSLLFDAYNEGKTYKDRCAQLKMEVIVAKQTGQAARKKMKKACSMLKDDDDMSNIASPSRRTSRSRS